MTDYRIQGLSIELIYTGEDKEYDVSYWSRLSYVKSMSRKELSVIVDIITEAIEKHYQRDRLDDIESTQQSNADAKALGIKLIQTGNHPMQSSNTPPLDDFLE